MPHANWILLYPKSKEISKSAKNKFSREENKREEEKN